MRRNPGAQILFLVFVAVKKMVPSSREVIGPQVFDECFFQRGVVFLSGSAWARGAHVGVGAWVPACRGVGAGVTMSVWACGCPGVPAYGCVGVCCFFSVRTCLSLTVLTTRGTVPLTLVTARHDRIPSKTFYYFLRLF